MPKKWLVVGLFEHLDCFMCNQKMLILDLVSSNSTLNRVGCRFFCKSCKCRLLYVIITNLNSKYKYKTFINFHIGTAILYVNALLIYKKLNPKRKNISIFHLPF